MIGEKSNTEPAGVTSYRAWTYGCDASGYCGSAKNLINPIHAVNYNGTTTIDITPFQRRPDEIEWWELWEAAEASDEVTEVVSRYLNVFGD